MQTRLRSVLLIPLGVALAATGAAASTCLGVAISTSIDPSARSLGMGGASSAVFWGGDPNEWANPALLGYHQGIRYGYSKYQMVPDLASDVFFSSTRLTFAAWGVGLSFAGQPNHLGGARLDYGLSAQTDVDGNVIGIFDSYETVESFGIGASLIELVESALGLAGTQSRFGRWGDLSLGWARKEAVVDLVSGASSPLTPGPARAKTNDLGLVLRVRPLDTVTQDGPGPRLASLGGMLLDASFALSSRNHDDASLDFGLGSPDPVEREERLAVAVHAATGLPPSWRDPFERNGMGWLAEGLVALLAGGATWERVQGSLPGSGGDRIDCDRADLYGVELTVANVLSLRWGYVDSPDRGIDEATWGLGLGFSLGGFLGVRYDHASTPQAAGLADRRDQGVTAYVDGLALARIVRNE